jgi:hypothetical protein
MQSLSATPQLVSWLSQGIVLFWLVHVLGVLCFAYIIARRMVPLMRAERDLRFDHPLQRFHNLLKYWFGQWKHPRYKAAGILHTLIFAGFIVLALRAFTVLIVGIDYGFVMPGLSGTAGRLYESVTDYAATIVFLCMIVAIVRRVVFKPARYEVPARFGKSHKADAIFLLSLIAALMFADSLFEATRAAALLPLTGSRIASLPVTSVAAADLPRASLDCHNRRFLLRRLSRSRTGVLFPALLSAVWHSVPRGDFALQHLFRQTRSQKVEASKVGPERPAIRPGQVFRREDF